VSALRERLTVDGGRWTRPVLDQASAAALATQGLVNRPPSTVNHKEGATSR
jgi:hypothetical protein